MQAVFGHKFRSLARREAKALGGTMKQLLMAMLIFSTAVACSNPVEPANKFTGDPPIRVDPAPVQSGFQINHAATRNP